MPMTDARQIAVVRSYDDLHEGLRARFAELGMTRLEIDRRAKLTGGHAAKLLAPYPIKALGRQTLGKVLAAGNVELWIVVRADAPQISDSGVKQVSTHRLPKPLKHRLGDMPEARTIKAQLAHKIAVKNGRKGGRVSGAARKRKLTDSQRRRIGRNAAKARWAKVHAANSMERTDA
jgi:hypothetical protein